MKTTIMYYNDDGTMVPGILIERFLHKPVFVSMKPECGWIRQTISKDTKKNLRPYKKPIFEDLIAATNRYFDNVHQMIEDDD